MSTFDFNFGDDHDESSTSGERFSSFSFWENEDCAQSKFFNQDDSAGVDFNMNVNSNDTNKKSTKSSFMAFDFGGNDEFSDCENSITLERNKRSEEHSNAKNACDKDEDKEISKGPRTIKDQWSDAEFGLEMEKKGKAKFGEFNNTDDSFLLGNSEVSKRSIEGGFDYVENRGTRGFEAAGELQGFMSEFAAEEFPKKPSGDAVNQANKKAPVKVSTSLFDDADFGSFKDENYHNMGKSLVQEQYNRKMPKCSFDNDEISVSFENRYATPLKIKKEFIESKEATQNEYLSPKMKTKSPMVMKRFLQNDKSPTNSDLKKRRVLFDEEISLPGCHARERRSGSPASIESNPVKQKTPKRPTGAVMSFDQEDGVSMKRQVDKQTSSKFTADHKPSMAVSTRPAMQVLLSYRNRVNAVCDRRIKTLELREKFQNKLLVLCQFLLDASRKVERRQAEKHARIFQNIRKMLMEEME